MSEYAQGDVAILPRTRTQLIDRLNHTFIPKVADSYALGGTPPLGATAFGNASIYYSTASPFIGGNTGQLVLNASGTNQGALLLQKNLSDLQLGTSTVYTVSLYINSPTGAPNPILLVNGPGTLGNSYSAATATKNQWTRISVTLTTAAANGQISVYLFFDSAGAQNTYTLFDALQIDDGGAPQPFFDGEGPLVADGYFYKWLSTRYNSLSAKYHFDPSEVKYPLFIKNGHHLAKDNGNVLHRTLSNALYVSRRPATLSLGTFTAFYPRRDSAFELYSLLDRLDDFQLIDNQNPEAGMFFSVDGRVLIDQDPEFVVPDTGQNAWTVTVPFQQTA